MKIINGIEYRFSMAKWQLYLKMTRCFGFGYPARIDAIKTSVTNVEKSMLYRLASKLPVGSISVEIGSYFGASSACIASAISRVSSNSRLYCIDTWMNDAVSDHRADIMSVFLENVRPYQGAIRCIRGYSAEVTQEIPENINFLFIDGDHSYEGVKKDLTNYIPKLKDGGILAMHDYAHYSVRRAIDEIVVPVEAKRLYCLGNFYSSVIRRKDA